MAKEIIKKYPQIKDNILALNELSTFRIGKAKSKLFFDTDAVFILAG